MGMRSQKRRAMTTTVVTTMIVIVMIAICQPLSPLSPESWPNGSPVEVTSMALGWARPQTAAAIVGDASVGPSCIVIERPTCCSRLFDLNSSSSVARPPELTWRGEAQA